MLDKTPIKKNHLNRLKENFINIPELIAYFWFVDLCQKLAVFLIADTFSLKF